MDGLNPDFTSFQELVASSTTATDSRPPLSRSSAEAGDNFDIGTSSSNAVYRFPSMQPPFNHPTSGHFMSQPVQPLPLPYSQVTHIPTSAHSYHSHHNVGGFSNGSLRSSSSSHNFPDEGHDYLTTSHNNPGNNCSIKTQLEDKRKGNVNKLNSIRNPFPATRAIAMKTNAINGPNCQEVERFEPDLIYERRTTRFKLSLSIRARISNFK